MEFSAEVIATGRGGHAVAVPREVARSLSGTGSAVRVVVGTAEARSQLMSWGGKTFLGLRQDFLKQIAASAGDQITLDVTAVAEPAAVPEQTTEPAALVAALERDGAAAAAYAALSAEHRLEYWRWVGGADTEDQQADRVDRTVRRLRTR